MNVLVSWVQSNVRLTTLNGSRIVGGIVFALNKCCVCLVVVSDMFFNTWIIMGLVLIVKDNVRLTKRAGVCETVQGSILY